MEPIYLESIRYILEPLLNIMIWSIISSAHLQYYITWSHIIRNKVAVRLDFPFLDTCVVW